MKMNATIAIPEDLYTRLIELRTTHYPDATWNRLLVELLRVAVDHAERKIKRGKQDE